MSETDLHSTVEYCISAAIRASSLSSATKSRSRLNFLRRASSCTTASELIFFTSWLTTDNIWTSGFNVVDSVVNGSDMVQLLLVHGRSFGRTPFLPPLMTHIGTTVPARTEPTIAGWKCVALASESQLLWLTTEKHSRNQQQRDKLVTVKKTTSFLKKTYGHKHVAKLFDCVVPKGSKRHFNIITGET